MPKSLVKYPSKSPPPCTVQDGALTKVLFVIDIQSGDIVQTARLELQGAISAISAILADGDEIYISSFGTDEVVVLQLAGSEA